MTLVPYLDAVTSAENVEDVWQIHVAAMAEYGFDRLIYGFTRSRTPRSFGGGDDILVLSNHDPAYLKKFLDDGLFRQAPMVRWAAENSGSCSWNWIARHHDSLTDGEKRVVALNRSFDIVAGYSVSFRDTSVRAKGAIALTAASGTSQDDVDAMWAREGPRIEMMNRVAHLKITNLPHNGKAKLTERQRAALEWVGDGKTTQDIALIMGLTPATVEKHLRLARKALEVETTAQAVLKAALRNQIFLMEG